ncbi:3-oxoacid CoA-transferase subunit B [Halalkalibacterium halodurans]|uniref:3-oxoacid CoA-transferase subunit B n=1 Tax=Halalkalibacterium halodurans TaxID=86665 RepID=UPI002E1F64CB|nr:3-oxoacid CoA-transferase subunit B [Halalkalibacterium halodurans]MED4085142.1 3-oxoacid CoA-transferase subunit B [Halalkalibacterium halodurans]MED4105280.1 3-oxoacid CoA-transferase subunit B [Halalkalibacterium halodurans]MED4109089.1 3-oxoacid CoA-transferase subunit B [Halalkalibacterium halodurans]MED4149001.1 3-oxoacid CoA-transferase subunit B [Halalkalibacterium halodurans]
MDVGINREKEKMVKRAVEELTDHMIVNLGIGIPSLVVDYVAEGKNIWFHAENGIIGMGKSPKKGEEEPHLCNAGGFPVTLKIGGVYVDSATAFALIRGGRLDVTMLGALQVSEQGDVANWIVPGRKVPGIGGAMELAVKANKVIILMNHVNRQGEPKIVKSCSYPLTAKKCVDMIITDMAVLQRKGERFQLTEVFAPYTIEDVLTYTEAELEVNRQSVRIREV